jgi:hypothetical protein
MQWRVKPPAFNLHVHLKEIPMGVCSHALFQNLVDDLAPTLPGYGLELFDKKARVPYPGLSVKGVKSLSLLNSIFKKFEDAPSAESDELALGKFLEANAKCASFSWPDTMSLTELDTLALGETKKSIHDFFFDDAGDYWWTSEKMFAGMLPGPGASVLANGDSFYHKIGMSPLSTTSRGLFELYHSETSKYSLWQETEKIRSATYGDFTLVQGSKLSFVPKNTEISRTICTEPLLNMMFQKGIGSMLEFALERRFGLNLAYQADKNRELARIGSLDGHFGTIDLSSASDTISFRMLRDVLPKLPFAWLSATRSEFTQLPDRSWVPLHMVSSMGNGFTFPLQTILFSCIVVGCYRALGLPVSYGRGDPFKVDLNPISKRVTVNPSTLGNFSVFGDDIIVCREAYSLVMRMLGYFGFVPNYEKSFADGPFRESCGRDYWSGIDVRGVYCHSLKTKHDIYSLINRLNDWSCNSGIPLWRTLGTLLEKVRFIPVPPWESDVSGVRVPLAAAGPLSRDFHTGCIIYKRYVTAFKGLSLLNVGALSKMPRKFFHNPPAIILSAVGGYIRDGLVVESQRRVRYTKRLSFSPSWDWWLPEHSRLTSAGWQAFLNNWPAWSLLGKE